MSLPLIDIGKVKVSEEAHSYLSAEAQITQRDIVAIARAVLEEYARTRIHVANLAEAKLRAKG